MNIPLNGRIAIVDDSIEQVQPLFKVLSKNQIPYVFYKGNDISYLPEENSRYNDIRLLFLDINLIDDTATPNTKNVKAVLYSVLKRVISPNNFPYVIIFWSRHQQELSEIVTDLFDNSLSDRKPIAFNFFVKSDFFPSFGTEENVQDVNLLEEIKKIITSNFSYSYLVDWENKIHKSAEKTLEDVFSSYHNFSNWSSNADSIVSKLGISYLGKSYESEEPKTRIKGSFKALNVVFTDTLEKEINDKDVINPQELFLDNSVNVSDTVYCINKKLLFSEDCNPIFYSGTVIIVMPNRYNKDFEEVLDSVLNNKQKTSDIISSMKKIWVNVTPLCDSVQSKIKYNRIVKGLMIDAKFQKNWFFNNEAVFVSPVFNFEGKNYFMILSFKHFFTIKNIGLSKKIRPVLRLRQHLLSEVQSKLARHVNRQGILYIE